MKRYERLNLDITTGLLLCTTAVFAFYERTFGTVATVDHEQLCGFCLRQSGTWLLCCCACARF